jgi:hypothetical protein
LNLSKTQDPGELLHVTQWTGDSKRIQSGFVPGTLKTAKGYMTRNASTLTASICLRDRSSKEIPGIAALLQRRKNISAFIHLDWKYWKEFPVDACSSSDLFSPVSICILRPQP